MKSWFHNTEELKNLLRLISVRDFEGGGINPDHAFRLWREMTVKIRKLKRTVYLIGNGASASMASHVAADLAKNAFVHTEVFSDLSLITAIANDLSYDEVFAEPLRRRMVPGDMLVAISSSGRSSNILHAAEEAIELGGQVVTLSAMSAENELRSLGTLNFYIPAQTYGDAETCHAAILHHWIDLVAAVSLYETAETEAATKIETVDIAILEKNGE